MAERGASIPELAPRSAAAVALALGLGLAMCLASALLAPTALAASGDGLEGDTAVMAFVPGEQGAPAVGGFDLGLILAVAVAILVAAVLVLGVGALVLRRRARAPFELPPGSPDSGAWWTCANCGRNNIVGSARCYACGAWHR